MRFLLLFLLLTFSCIKAADVSPPPAAEVERLDLDPFYQKYISADGFPIVASEKVSDFALKEAAFVIGKMLENLPDVRDALIGEKVRLAIMATDEFTTNIPEHRHLQPKEYWDKRARGLGSSKEHPAVSCGEENLLRYRGDPYFDESIMVHEFAHSIHLQGLNIIDSEFQKKLEQSFNRAALKGLWKGKYAGTNPAEYWAEGVQSWFDTNRENDFEHNHVDTREELKAHDPGLSTLVESVFGDGDWRYLPPAKRKDPGHLAGYDSSEGKVFSWPKEMEKAYEDHQAGKHLARMQIMNPVFLSDHAVSMRSAKGVQIRLRNKTNQTLKFSWVDFEGNVTQYGLADPGREFHQSTFQDHLWIITGEDGERIGWCSAPGEDAMGEIQ